MISSFRFDSGTQSLWISLEYSSYGLHFAVGAEADDERIELLLTQVKNKDVTELIAAGREKLASVPAGGGAVAVAASAAGTGGGGAATAAAEPKKVEKVEEKEESDDVSLPVCLYIYLVIVCFRSCAFSSSCLILL